MIQGDGFFVTRSGDEQLYTRAGAFTFDETGNAGDPDGGLRPGLPRSTPPATRPAGLTDDLPRPRQRGPGRARRRAMTSYNIGADGILRGIFADGVAARPRPARDRRLHQPDGAREGRRDLLPRELPTPAPPQLRRAPGEGRRGTLMGGALEMSNVDLAAEFTNLILAQRGFQASSRVITTSDQVLEDARQHQALTRVSAESCRARAAATRVPPQVGRSPGPADERHEGHGRPSATNAQGRRHDRADPTLGLGVRPELRPDRAHRQHT